MRPLLGGLLGRLRAYLVLGLGFVLLFRGFTRPSVVQGVVGGGLVLAGMYLMVLARRNPSSEELSQLSPAVPEGGKEDNAGDSVHRSGQGS